VSLYSYGPAGWLQSVTDPRGLVSQTSYDNLGRVTQTIEDYTNGVPAANSNKTTQYSYDGDNNLLTYTAVEPGGASQVTRYVYGSTTASGSDVNSNDLLVAVQHPDKSTGQPSASEQDTDTVNALGETKTATDRNGTVHSYSYDVLGRLTADAVTTLGAGIDGSIRRLQIGYDTGGRPYLHTSYDAATGGNVVNQVQQAFNGLGQLTAEYQAHAGAVNLSTTPVVQYAYTDLAGGTNNSRLVSMTYPNGRVLNYNYNTGLDNTISRLSSLSDNSATLEAYSYLGLDTVVKRAHPQSGVDLTYIKQGGAQTGDAGDQSTGLDRFGRVAQQYWVSSTTGTVTDNFQYTFDRNSNVLTKANLLNTSLNEQYSYDGLNQLTSCARGSHTQSWTLDALSNFSSVTTDGTTQTRTHNQQNEVTGVGSSVLTFDAAGNTTTDQTGQQYLYDVWDPLVQVKSATGLVLASYSYNALSRRIVENSGTAKDLYYSAAWQVLEEQVGGQPRVQYVWSPVYRDLSPTLGRWQQSDPLAFVAGDNNLYRFVSGNPPGQVDPLGLSGRSPDPGPSAIPEDLRGLRRLEVER
jgi:YD repeat-containing protein